MTTTVQSWWDFQSLDGVRMQPLEKASSAPRGPGGCRGDSDRCHRSTCPGQGIATRTEHPLPPPTSHPARSFLRQARRRSCFGSQEAAALPSASSLELFQPCLLLRLAVPLPTCQTRARNRNRSLKFTTRHSGFQKYKQKWQSSRGKIHFFRDDLSLEHVLLICSQGKASVFV